MWSIKGEPGSWKATWMVNDTTEVKVPLSLDNRTVVLRLATEDGPIRLTGNVWMESRIWEGSGQLANGDWHQWSAIRSDEIAEDAAKEDVEQVADTASPAVEGNMEASEDMDLSRARPTRVGVPYGLRHAGTAAEERRFGFVAPPCGHAKTNGVLNGPTC